MLKGALTVPSEIVSAVVVDSTVPVLSVAEVAAMMIVPKSWPLVVSETPAPVVPEPESVWPVVQRVAENRLCRHVPGGAYRAVAVGVK